MIMLEIAVRTHSLANSRSHWSVKARRAKHERTATRIAWLGAGRPTIVLPAAVTLVRIAPRALDDDNLRSALKGARDEIAKIAGVDDRDPRITWAYAQERGPAKVYAVRVEIARVEGVAA